MRNWTDNKLQKAQIPTGKTKLSLADPNTPNLYFEVRRKSRSFVFRMRRNGNTVSHTIGHFPDISLSQARQEVRRLRKVDFSAIAKDHVPPSQTLGEFVETHFVDYLRQQQKMWAVNLAQYRIHIEPTFGTMRLDAIDKIAAHKWINGLIRKRLAHSTINKIVSIFGQIIGLAESLGIEGAPARKSLLLKTLKEKPTHTVYLKPHEAMRLIAAVQTSGNPDLPDIVALLLFTGARKREVLDMEWEHVDLPNSMWTVPQSKNGKPRYVQLSQNAHDLLGHRKNIRENGQCFVFPNPSTGKPYRCFYNAWDLARKKAGLPRLRVHDLRHSFASALVNTGIPLYDVQHLLGHASIKTTQRYAHLSQERLQASVKKIDDIYGKK